MVPIYCALAQWNAIIAMHCDAHAPLFNAKQKIHGTASAVPNAMHNASSTEHKNKVPTNCALTQ